MEKSNAWHDSPAWGAGLALLAALGFSLKAIFVKLAYPYGVDAITLVMALVLLRMERHEALIPPSVRLTEMFVDDMDGQLRESGVGDLVVGKHMGKLMGVLGGRLGALREALPQGEAALTEVIARNVSLVEGADPLIATRAALALAATLDATADEDLLAGRIAR